jgi:nitrite reductase (NADH) small subunit
MSEFVTVGKVDEFQEGIGRAFPVNGRMVAVFRKGDSFHAIDDMCPHMGASLSTGYVEGNAVTCPWHAWRFCVKDGTWLDNPKAKIRTDAYPVRVVGDEIQVSIPEPPPRTPVENEG